MPFFLQSSEKGNKSRDGSLSEEGGRERRSEQMSECLFKIIYLREGEGGGEEDQPTRRESKTNINLEELEEEERKGNSTLVIAAAAAKLEEDVVGDNKEK